eukprot:472953-Karenia_brevis.AAC.1
MHSSGGCAELVSELQLNNALAQRPITQAYVSTTSNSPPTTTDAVVTTARLRSKWTQTSSDHAVVDALDNQTPAWTVGSNFGMKGNNP